jgi:hypothetical protein
LLPDSKWEGNSIDIIGGRFYHGGGNGMWLAPGPSQTIAAGMFVSPAAAKRLDARCAGEGIGVFYSNLHRDRAQRETGSDEPVDFLLITLKPATAQGLCSSLPRSSTRTGMLIGSDPS